MGKFLDKLVEFANVTETENGDKAYKSTLNGIYDMFGRAGTMRDEYDENECVTLFTNAFNDNPLYAIRLLFYIRDVRGGQGVKYFFRKVMVYLAKNEPKLTCALVDYIPEYGSWKDIIDLLSYSDGYSAMVENYIVNKIGSQLVQDGKNILEGKNISLLAKWMPSENTSSHETRMLAKKLRIALNLNSKDYRKMLSKYRAHLNVVETKMCANTWDGIKYETVPSKAMQNYSNAFTRHDEIRFNQYLDSVKTGKTKINAKTLYPYDLIHQLQKDLADSKTIEAQWNALPDYFAGKKDNSIVVADVSGSMFGNPIEVCISLALYIAERNKGEFHNKFITFSASPNLQSIKGNSLIQKLTSIESSDWGMNTDLDAVFQLLYNAAEQTNVEDLPSTIYIISDMQFDDCMENGNKTTFEKWQKKFGLELGKPLPRVVFWNVSNYATFPITVHNSGAILVSGFSPSILKYVMEDKISDGRELLEEIVNSDRYKNILSTEELHKLIG